MTPDTEARLDPLTGKPRPDYARAVREATPDERQNVSSRRRDDMGDDPDGDFEELDRIEAMTRVRPMTPDSEAGPDEPRTEALAKALAHIYIERDLFNGNDYRAENVAREDAPELRAAIESEVRDELRERVAGLPDAIVNRLPPSGLIERAAVLALFDEPESQS